jgi:asparagine synthase (glutamine-hydrolysing)
VCGIVGQFCFSGDQVPDQALLRRMLGAIRHRGPDQFGIYLYEDRSCRLGLGNARLNIIDPVGGQQPISNESGTLWIVFNGEIFNYLELREELQRLGHRLRTRTDTEVIVHLFEQYGIDCLDRLNGQFALALWDERTQELFLARDRLGVRPLFYTQQSGVFRFASEIKALLADGRVAAELDPVALDQIFTYWSPLAPRTALRGIRSLPPGHWLRVGPRGDLHVRQYWRLGFPPAGAESYGDAGEAAERLRDLLIDASRLRLRADVPVGAYLSGGLDSSLIAALIRRFSDNRLETFSVAFTDPAFDESGYQRQAAEHFGTRHHAITCSPADIGRVFPEVIWHTEVPLLRTSPAPLYLLSRLVRDHGFKVVLTGEGADEFLAGYNLFKEVKVRRFWARQPDSRWRPLLLTRLYGYVHGLQGGNSRWLARFFGQGLKDVACPTYSHDLRWRNTQRLKRLFSPALTDGIAGLRRDECGCSGGVSQIGREVSLPDDFSSWSPLARAQYLEATIFMSEYLLCSQGDRVAMAHSVEGRFPFLDHRVVEFCGLLKPRLKLHGLKEKHLLKKVARPFLPDAVWRRDKQPYRAPIEASFFPGGKPLDWVDELLAPKSLEAAGCFQPSAVQWLLTKLRQQGFLSETDGMGLTGVLSTQLLHRQFIGQRRSPPSLSDSEDVKVVIRGAGQPGAHSAPGVTA